MRLIDADAAADKIMREIEIHADEIGVGGVALMIGFARAFRDENDFPTIEAEPVRRGRWCPNCGAKMDLRTPTEVQLDEADSVMMGGAENG